MRLFVKPFIHTYSFYDEKETLIGKVKKRIQNSAELEILNSQEKNAGFVRKNGETLFVKNAFGATFSCHFLYKTDAKGNRVQKSFVRPPMAEKIEVHTEWGPLTIRQTPDRVFDIFLAQKSIGKIKNMLGIKKEIQICSGEIALVFYMGLFSICLFMIHDDDIMIV